MKPVKITSSRHKAVSSYIFFLIALPVIAYFIYPIINVYGVILLGIFWLIYLFGIVSHIIASRKYYEFTDQELRISDGRQTVTIFFYDILDVNLQIAIEKRMGVYESFPYFVFKLNEKDKYAINELATGKKDFFIQRTDDFSDYMSPERGDLYLYTGNFKLRSLDEIKKRLNKEITTLKPLVKTDDQAEYDEIVNSNFVEEAS